MTTAGTDRKRDAMSFRELAAWAWEDTARIHSSRANLLIHIVAVPMFVVGHLLLIAAIASGWRWLAAGVSCIFVSLVLQRVGHSTESQAIEPFAGGRDFVRRLYIEQFYNFWRLLFSGAWFASLRRARR